MQLTPKRAQIFLSRPIEAGQASTYLRQQTVDKKRNEQLEQRVRTMRHRRRLSGREIETQCDVEHMDKPAAHRRGPFLNAVGIDLGQDFEAAPASGYHPDYLASAQEPVMIAQNVSAIGTTECMSPSRGEQRIGLLP